MSKKLVGALVAVSLSLVTLTAFADETSAPPAPPAPPAPAAAAAKVHVLKTVVVVGRRQLPSVVVEIARLSAAHEAGAAHDNMRSAMLEQSVAAPAPLK